MTAPGQMAEAGRRRGEPKVCLRGNLSLFSETIELCLPKSISSVS
jgi:hypothetical protein